ncbi:DUF4249 domain-containing protein [Flavobacterium pallidum]|uniref:DUF4249 domain-containing protein n=1 Tax=Flavobacterium pallidum TaxID=2172098 RepID=A0A2S1SH35_9FLAO|nr:DUF4249 domain-containing protein [Flavobacterium pallidum]AWI25724.1 DUF4249 domain-containing protein [Flavobacterium pallidum]
MRTINKNFKYILLLIAAVSISSCEEVVDVDLNTAAPKLVIDASIDWVKGTDGSHQKVKLTTTTGFYETEIPVVSNAQVRISNSSNTIFEFIESPGTGEYLCDNFVPQIGETYKLTVISGGQTYEATEKLFAAPDVESVAQNNEGGVSGKDIELKYFFSDNGAENNFYLTAFETNITVFPDYDAFDDEFFQGNQTYGFYLNEDLKAGDETTFSIYGVSQRYMNYMAILTEITEGGGGPWSSPPTNVRGNIINYTDSKNFALGYFRVSEVSKMDYTVQ